jgi:hypothetical protein
MKAKYIVVDLQERNGEQEYWHPAVLKVPSTSTPEKVANKYCKNFWGTDGKKNEDGWFEFQSGCIWVRVRTIKPITKKEFDVLSKFI